jgi:Flp pilus assembly protein TadB
MEHDETPTSVVLSSRRLFSRDVNYLRDLALFWPFVLYTIFGVASLFSPPDRRLGLRFGVLAVAALLLAREKLLLLIVGLGFIAILCANNLVLHPWSWSVFVAGILASCPLIVANQYWRSRKLSYGLPREFRLVDALWSIASLCASLALVYVVSPYNHLW